MILFFDKNTNRLVFSSGGEAIRNLEATSGGVIPVQLGFLDDGVTVLLPTVGREIRIGIRTVGGTLVAAQDEWKLQTPSNRYLCNLNLNTVEMIAAFGDFLEMEARLQVIWKTENDGPYHSTVANITIDRSVISFADGTPVGVPDPEQWMEEWFQDHQTLTVIEDEDTVLVGDESDGNKPKWATFTAVWNWITEKLADIGFIRYDEAQDLTDEQKLQARENIGAEDAASFLELDDTPDAYAGSAGKPVIVNEAGEALDFGEWPPGEPENLNLIHCSNPFGSSLHLVPTVDLPIGHRVSIGRGFRTFEEHVYQLVEWPFGAQNIPPVVILPADYHGTSNFKVWRRISGVNMPYPTYRNPSLPTPTGLIESRESVFYFAEWGDDTFGAVNDITRPFKGNGLIIPHKATLFGLDGCTPLIVLSLDSSNPTDITLLGRFTPRFTSATGPQVESRIRGSGQEIHLNIATLPVTSASHGKLVLERVGLRSSPLSTVGGHIDFYHCNLKNCVLAAWKDINAGGGGGGTSGDPGEGYTHGYQVKIYNSTVENVSIEADSLHGYTTSYHDLAFWSTVGNEPFYLNCAEIL